MRPAEHLVPERAALDKAHAEHLEVGRQVERVDEAQEAEEEAQMVDNNGATGDSADARVEKLAKLALTVDIAEDDGDDEWESDNDM